jgi:6-phosphofructo-2-kinase / fructose-2,6-biphosphatase 3
VFKVEEAASTETLKQINEWFKSGNNVAIIDGMHLTRESRNLVGNYCRESVYHHLIVEFDCDEKCVEDNIKDTASFYQKIDDNQNWLQVLNEKSEKYKGKFEKCCPMEGPLITVNNSENQMIHSVTAKRVQGLLQTIILGVLSSPVIKHRVFYLSRVIRLAFQ